MRVSVITDHQPPPVRSNRPAVQDLVIADVGARRDVGIERYGTVLQVFNGRSGILDAYQESLDLVVYLRQVLAEVAATHEVLAAALTWYARLSRSVEQTLPPELIQLRDACTALLAHGPVTLTAPDGSVVHVDPGSRPA